MLNNPSLLINKNGVLNPILDAALIKKTISGNYYSILLHDASNGLPYRSIRFDISSSLSSITFSYGGAVLDITGTDTTNGYIDNSYIGSGGTIASNEDFYVSEYIPVEAGKKYAFRHAAVSNTFRYALYSSDKSYVSATGYVNRRYHEITIPDSGVAYVRLSIAKTSAYQQFIGLCKSITTSFGKSVSNGYYDVISGTLYDADTGTKTQLDPIKLHTAYGTNFIVSNASSIIVNASYYVDATLAYQTLQNL